MRIPYFYFSSPIAFMVFHTKYPDFAICDVSMIKYAIFKR